MKKHICLSLLFVFSFFVNARTTPLIKVKIAGDLKKIDLSGLNLKQKIASTGKIKSFLGRKKIQFNCDKTKWGPRKPSLVASVKSSSGLVSFLGKRYQGKLHILSSAKLDTCDLVNEVNIDSYISTLLSNEMNGSWPVEALKAQAVAARTYAIYKMKNQQVSKKLGYKAHYDIESSEKHQVSGSFFDITGNTWKASKSTQGEVLKTEAGNLTPIFFHAKCGGRTLRPDEVWTNPIEGYSPVKCGFCDDHGKKNWESFISFKRFMSFLEWGQRKGHFAKKIDLKKKQKVKIVRDAQERKNLRLYFGDNLLVINKPLFRRYFGRRIFSSNYYNLSFDRSKKGFSILGKGLGHGVGMCQLGALNLSKKGWNYKDILAHYFPKHKIKKVY